MPKSNKKSGNIVVPGDRLGVIEEFTPASGTYVKQGIIYSKNVGCTLLDVLKKEISVHPLAPPAVIPGPGSTVIGQVSGTKSNFAIVRISEVGGKNLSGFFSGFLHVSDVSEQYVNSMFDACKLGDVIRAKVTSVKNRSRHLTTVGKHLGVIYAFCSRCGYLLQRKGLRMYCPRCGNREKRKIASDYGEAAL
ncbi:MAG: exosome complex RNA-binding protein Csl4 [Thermoproteota archaeon]|nr:exosome complex RNA-binding protein Csl4 [Thermoproteota archaeon]